ncbi:ADOP family duplicated permease [Roseisolibacter sp. H3M3-2]|uniref:ADOP family duplicated permease n=1 Tax=Roseisolibacter sp. H3M3-2 TaxID=3031323 RepID=UPI0023D99785|nr:ADOP family duplicated permease [Roseisolibacter sp. H3M3-2]MDF1505890.1 ADOP family duplicated permease [Roseisolibacter sp. H3M3-2]
MLATPLSTLRRALLALARSRGYLAAAALTLAVGIGATTALFGVVDAVLLRPLPYAAPERLVRVWPEGGVGKMTLASLQRRARAFAALEGWQPPQPVSDAFWRVQLGADARAVGRLVRVDGVAHRVVGVMPPSFRLPAPDVALWTPVRMDPAQVADYTWFWNLSLVGRLAPGVTAAQARAEARTLVPALRGEFPMRLPDEWGATMDVQPMQEAIVGRTRGTLYLLLGAVSVMLVVSIVNVAGLTLVRAARRERELTVRAALGAGRGRLFGELVAEGLVLAGVVAALGAALAWALTRGIVRMLPAGSSGVLPRVEEIAGDRRVLGVAVLVAVGAGALSTLIPAARASRPTVRGALAEGGRGSAGGRARQRTLRWLVTAQVGLGVTLAAGAGLLGLSLLRLLDEDPGFRAERVAVTAVPLPSVERDTAARARAFYGALLPRVRAIPGVTAAAMATGVPFDGGEGYGPIDVERFPTPPGGSRPNVANNTITADYARVLGVPLLAGRMLTDADRDGATPVAVVDAEAAKVLWEGMDPKDVIGQRVKYVYLDQWITVVGVVGNVRRDSLSARPAPTLYRPIGQGFAGPMRLVVRGTAAPETLAPALRRAVAELEPTVPLGRVEPLAGVVARSAARARFVAQLLAGFALVAVALGAVGVYGVVAYSVARRTREIGVRSALGASPLQIRALVLRDGARMAAAGIAATLAGALAAAGLGWAFLHGVRPVEPAVLLGVSATLLLVVLAASALPARRAARVDPLEALRTE